MMAILKAILNYAIPIVLGFCLGVIKKKLKEEKNQNEALKCLLQNSLTNIFYVYNAIGEIPDYALKNWINLMKPYEALDGDDYIHELDIMIRKMPVKATGIIK